MDQDLGAVKVYVASPTRVVLICNPAKARSDDPVEYWALPGGNIKLDEDVIEAGIREVREETGLELDRKQIVQRPQRERLQGDPYWSHLCIAFVGEEIIGDRREWTGREIDGAKVQEIKVAAASRSDILNRTDLVGSHRPLIAEAEKALSGKLMCA